jgi:aerobic C4-dicarboxylate transport protein
MRALARTLYFWVLIGVLAGVLIGAVAPATAVALQPVADGFIALIKMLIGPVVFCTIVQGITGSGDLKKFGRIGLKAIIYFEVMSTLALGAGLLVGNLLAPGRGMHARLADLDASRVASYASEARRMGVTEYLLHIVPRTFFDAFTGAGDLLQVLLVAILFGVALGQLGERGARLKEFVASAGDVLMRMVGLVLYAAPLGAGAAMAATIGRYGLSTLKQLAALIGVFYASCALFVLVALGLVSWLCGFSILRFIRYIRAELLLVLGTSSSEAALVPLMAKLERLGCSKSVVGLVVPAGYSFNLDGTSLYLTLATLFVAQALDVPLSPAEQLAVIGIAMLSSKGAAAVTGGGFITLAATLSIVPSVPVAGLALILGVDRFMSEARALTNCIGNGVAALVVARTESELDRDRLRAELAAGPG